MAGKAGTPQKSKDSVAGDEEVWLALRDPQAKEMEADGPAGPQV